MLLTTGEDFKMAGKGLTRRRIAKALMDTEGTLLEADKDTNSKPDKATTDISL